MTSISKIFNKSQQKEKIPEVRPGDIIRVYQKVKRGKKRRTQIFEGRVIARKHGKGVSATITVRKEISGVGVEQIFPIHSPIIEKIEVIKRGRPKRSKLYYLRKAKGKRARLKREEFFSSKEEVPSESKRETAPFKAKSFKKEKGE